ncbi:MAG: tetratricopeptide repeat protein [Candidatus Porifericomitaceae bacterium WSBS_2022_MAG_OTU9]
MATWRILPLLLLALPAWGETLLSQAHEHWQHGRYSAATDMFRPLAAKGNPVAQFYMGEASRLGLGIEEDIENSITWYKLAVEQGFPPAENTMAVWLLEHDADDILIPQLLIRAATKGYAPAQYNLCRLYATGEQLEKDQTRAVWWCTKAAQQGHRDAQQAVVLAHEHGIGTEQDQEEAQRLREQYNQPKQQ